MTKAGKIGSSASAGIRASMAPKKTLCRTLTGTEGFGAGCGQAAGSTALMRRPGEPSQCSKAPTRLPAASAVKSASSAPSPITVSWPMAQEVPI